MVTQVLQVIPSPDTPNHSYVDEITIVGGLYNTVRHGPIPDVLVDEVKHELQEKLKNYMEGFTKLLKGELGNGSSNDND